MNSKDLIRRQCNRLGLGMLAFMGCALLGGGFLAILLKALFPRFGGNNIVLMIVNDVVNYGLAPLVLWLIIRSLPKGKLRERSISPRRGGKLILEAFALMYIFALLTNLVVTLLTLATGQETGNLLESATANLPPWAMILFLVILAPICEEVIFRHLLLRRMLSLGPRTAVILSAVSFGLFHCNLYQFFYATALGFLFGCIAFKTGRLRYVIAIHAILNFFGSVVVLWIESATAVYMIYVAVLLAVVIAGAILFCKDLRSLYPVQCNPPGTWKAVLTSPGLLSFFVIIGLLSIFVLFIV